MKVGENQEVQDLIILEKKNGKTIQKIIPQLRFVPFTRKND